MNLTDLSIRNQRRLNKHIELIKGCNSRELLDYSKRLMKLKKHIGVNVSDFLFKEIQKRSEYLNYGHDVEKLNSERLMIDNFNKGR